MPHRAPLIGRRAELAQALEVLRSPRAGGLLIHAPTGRGKTAFAGAVAAALGADVRWVHADRVLARYPYGALSPVLDLDPPPWGDMDPAELRHIVARALISPVPRVDRAVVIVDDADDLDVPSSTVLSQLVIAGAIRIVVLSRRHPSTSVQFGSLVHDGVLTSMELQPLTPDDVRELLHEHLGGSVPTTVEDFFLHRCGGNPRILEGWLTAAREQSVVVSRNGVWLLTGRPLVPSSMVRDIGLHFIDGIDPSMRTAADLVALAGDVPVRIAVAAGLGEEIDVLVRVGLCTVIENGEPRVRFTGDAYAMLHRATIPQGRAIVLRTGIGKDIEPSPDDLHRRMGWICWSLDCGIELPHRMLLQTAREAVAAGDPLFAHMVLTSIGAESLEPARRLALATALCDINRTLLAADLLLQALPEVENPEDVDRSALVWGRILLRLDTPAAELPDAVTRWEEMVGGPSPSPAVREQRALIACLLRTVLCTPVPDADALDLDRELRAQVTAHPEPGAARALALVALSGHHAHRGTLDLAVEQARSAFAADTTGESRADLHRLLRHTHPAYGASALPTVRNGPGGTTRGISASGPAQLAQETGPSELERGLEALRRNDLATATAALRIAVEALTLWDDRQLLHLALASAAYTAALVPDTATSDSLLERLDDLDRRDTNATLLSRATAATARHIRRPDAAHVTELQACAAEARRRGSVSVEADIHLLLLSAGGVCLRILDGPIPPLTEQVTDPRVIRHAGIAEALATGRPAELIRMGESLGSGYPLMARTLAEEARRLAQEDGDPQAQARASALLRSTGAPAEGILSRREREVADRILEGRSNAEIAEQLGLTTRTVEGHVYRLYRRLGISRRQELTAEHLHLPGAIE